MISAILALTTINVTAQEVALEEELERISVTGSRILREGAEAPSPVTIITGEELMSTGAISIGEALNELPSLANTYSMANAGRFLGSAGLNLLDLRGMGTDRTLVLVDGKRHVSSSSGTSAVDTNTIPTAWIERVEIITGGASAVYGADAVTGVVNFVLKKNITGFDFSATKSYAGEGPYDSDKLNLSFGQDFADGRGNFGIAISSTRQDGMNALDRAQTRTSKHTVNNPLDGDTQNEDGSFNHDGIPDELWLDDAGWFDDSTSGNFYTYNGDTGEANWFIFNPDGSVRPQKLGTTYSDWGKCSGDCDKLELQRYVELQPTFKSFNVSLKANYDVTDDMNVYGEVKFNRNKADSIDQPSFFEYGDEKTGGFTITRDNAFIDQSLLDVMDQFADIGYGESINVHRFMEDSGRRSEQNEREQTRFVVGVEGVIGDDWDYDFYATYGKTESEQVNTGNTVVSRVRQAVDAIKLDNGDIVCRDEAARAAGCVPANLFGFGAVTDEAAAWFNTTSKSKTEIQQTVISGSVTNSALFELPAGPVGFAMGAEYRKEQSDTNPDEFAATGATFQTAVQEEHGDFDVNEVFFEMSVPLLSDVAFVQDLTGDVAVRFADYSTIGDATSWKLGLNWAINDDLKVRATLSEAIRAPNITELFGPVSQSFFNRMDDPCQAGNAQDAIRVANCTALGIPADFPALATVASIDGLSGGNPELKEEESQSLTYGIVYQPSYLEGFVFIADYWKIEIDDAIEVIDGQDILNKCVDTISGIDNQFCDLITRDADNEIRFIRSITQNVAKQKAEGVDFELGYDFDVFGGQFTSKVVGTYLISRKEFPFQTSPDEFIEYSGYEGEAEWQANVLLSYKTDNWKFSSKTRYLDSVSRFTEQELERNPDENNILGYGTYVVSDIRGSYNFDNGLTLAFGIDNMFDRDLPLYTTGTGEATASYDNIGRMYYTSVSFSM